MGRARAVHAIYDRGYAFPTWSLHRPAGRAMVLYHPQDSVKEVKQMATEREPVNIAMHRAYDQPALEREFGWARGAYQLSTAKRLMPNIAVACTIPFSSVARDGTEKATTPGGKVASVHVVNLVGYAFDSPAQPDARYFQLSPKKSLAALLRAYTEVWKLGFWACHEWFPTGVRARLMVAEVGSGAFRPPFMSEGQFRDKIHTPAVRAAQVWLKRVAGRTVEALQMGHIPGAVFEQLAADLKRTMFVNAWDPWSMLGNGNAADLSLDGMWGRHSGVAVTGWPLSNPAIQYRAIPK